MNEPEHRKTSLDGFPTAVTDDREVLKDIEEELYTRQWLFTIHILHRHRGARQRDEKYFLSPHLTGPCRHRPTEGPLFFINRMISYLFSAAMDRSGMYQQCSENTQHPRSSFDTGIYPTDERRVHPDFIRQDERACRKVHVFVQ
ncbi:MAG TPA: hypothetical protein PLZ30_06190 [Deltaproteobacteria bacterium]|jgi:hypothetical protein|nr:hypothetical protein [Deltaproteobacteria bacterium]HOD70052.1 hypothetical protein [Deltaproteobacteria bacterium]HOS27446.1 hypothetical protein [Deltaproteobacteria bacterium]HPV29911.1 hypothetical protein [Deltaproteobacteria bacterium]HQQ15244.1 hypothetical protein [Deltaproteobacteria bacterium]